jgi:serine/threonine-protein kinase RsbW
MHQARFSAKLETLPSMMQWAEEILKPLQLPYENKILLALEEALVNIIHYAYPEKEKGIEIECRLFSDFLEFVIRDQGKPFNPLLLKEPSLNQSLEKRKEGGLGILFIKKCMDEVKYERKEPFNILILKKKI